MSLLDFLGREDTLLAGGPGPGRHADGRVNVITHLHTDASNAEASEMDVITDAIRSVMGADTTMSWSECFTPIETVARLLRAGRTLRGPVHLCFVTDHMRARAHLLPLGHLVAAARDPRLALGAEVRTRARDVDGVYRPAPEIIIYGRAAPVAGPAGPHYGVSQELLDELWDTCRDDDGLELCTRKARALLLRRGVAHGLSHPFDGHELSLEGTFRLISEFTFIEVVNGGYFAPSARTLDAYVRFHNAIVAGAAIPAEALSPTGRRLVAHIRERGRPLCPLSGADAHSHDLDRVVRSVAVPPGRSVEGFTPGDLCAGLLALEEGGAGVAAPVWTPRPEAHPVTASPRLANLGTPASQLRQLSDILVIIGRNLWAARQHYSPRTLVQTVTITARVTAGELRRRALQRARLEQSLREEFDPAALLPLLTVPTRAGTRPVLRAVPQAAAG
jgi:hypothetical protein